MCHTCPKARAVARVCRAVSGPMGGRREGGGVEGGERLRKIEESLLGTKFGPLSSRFERFCALAATVLGAPCERSFPAVFARHRGCLEWGGQG
jgi:hypothetical protein